MVIFPVKKTGLAPAVIRENMPKMCVTKKCGILGWILKMVMLFKTYSYKIHIKNTHGSNIT